jgi:hypothetical protein
MTADFTGLQCLSLLNSPYLLRSLRLRAKRLLPFSDGMTALFIAGLASSRAATTLPARGRKCTPVLNRMLIGLTSAFRKSAPHFSRRNLQLSLRDIDAGDA